MNGKADHNDPEARPGTVNVRLDPRQIERFEEWLADMRPGGLPPCGFCGSDDMRISDIGRCHPSTVTTGTDLLGAFARFDPIIYSVALVCAKCGVLLSFDGRTVFGAPLPKDTEGANE